MPALPTEELLYQIAWGASPRLGWRGCYQLLLSANAKPEDATRVCDAVFKQPQRFLLPDPYQTLGVWWFANSEGYLKGEHDVAGLISGIRNLKPVWVAVYRQTGEHEIEEKLWKLTLRIHGHGETK